MSPTHASDHRRGGGAGARVLDLSVLGALAALLAWWSWGRWPDVLVDFGQQLYVPWQLAASKVLYRDIAFLNGPLSAYAHALLFRVFGPGLAVLAVANLALLGVLLIVMHALLLRVGSRASAFLACATFLCVFAFAQQLPIGNYNFVTPYAYEITHGVLLALAALLFLGRFAAGGTLRDVAACGFCVGLVCLTKPELLVATVAAVSFGLVLLLWLCPACRGRGVGVVVAVFGAAVLLPVLVAAALLALALPAGEALADALGGIRWVLAPVVGASRFYKAKMGLIDPAASLRTIAWWTVVYAAWTFAAAIVGALLSRAGRVARWAPAVVFLVLLATLLLLQGQIRWSQVLFPLPVFMIVAAAGFLLAALRATDPEGRARRLLIATVALFALLLLGKILLRVRPSHYGFALAMPATVLLLVLLWDWVPRLVAPGDAARRTLHAALLAALIAAVTAHLQTTAGYLAAKTVRVGSGRDAFWADARGLEVVRTLDLIAARVPPGATLAVVPDGPIMNYLARRTTTTPYLLLNPVAVGLYGEDAMLESFAAAPPDFILLLDWPMQEFGAGSFGDGYGERIAGWIGAHYRVVGSASGRSMALLRRTGR